MTGLEETGITGIIFRNVTGHLLRLYFSYTVIRVAALVEAGIGAQQHSDWNIL